jgi:hypothetical protein
MYITFVNAKAVLLIFLHGSFYSITIMVPVLSRRNYLQEGLNITMISPCSLFSLQHFVNFFSEIFPPIFPTLCEYSLLHPSPQISQSASFIRQSECIPMHFGSCLGEKESDSSPFEARVSEGVEFLSGKINRFCPAPSLTRQSYSNITSSSL